MTSTQAVPNPRNDRKFVLDGPPEQRGIFERDRDRVLYCSALRRLAGVTQVVGAVEGHSFHNRLTHTLEAAQLARRLAEKFLRDSPGLANKLEINHEVAEAAALIHDLGHPPFGHAGETELNDVAKEFGSEDGFQGNAQSFRIVTRLAAHRVTYRGLNLTRATLNGSLKYPWQRDPDDPKKEEKYGVYECDHDEFDWVRIDMPPNQVSVEAQIMDLADDIAYSVHDLEDFLRAGLIPLAELRNPRALDRFLGEWLDEAKKKDPVLADLIEKNQAAPSQWLETWPDVPVNLTWGQRAGLKRMSSGAINGFVSNATIQERDKDGQVVVVSNGSRILMKFSQRVVWQYVISNPRLTAIQYGQRRAIRDLMTVYKEAIVDACGEQEDRGLDLIPPRFRDGLNDLEADDEDGVARLAVDIVASMTDEQAVMLHRRFLGVEQRGSITDIVY